MVLSSSRNRRTIELSVGDKGTLAFLDRDRCAVELRKVDVEALLGFLLVCHLDGVAPVDHEDFDLLYEASDDAGLTVNVFPVRPPMSAEEATREIDASD